MEVTTLNRCLYVNELNGGKWPAPLRDALSRGGKCMCGRVLPLQNVRFFHLKKEKCLEQLFQQNSFISPILMHMPLPMEMDPVFTTFFRSARAAFIGKNL